MSFRVVQDPRSAAQWAVGNMWAIAMANTAEAAVWLTLPDCAQPTVYAPDATHFDQLMRTVALKQPTDGLALADALNTMLAAAATPPVDPATVATDVVTDIGNDLN